MTTILQIGDETQKESRMSKRADFDCLKHLLGFMV